MACGGATGLRQKTLNAVSVGFSVEWFIDWLPAIGLDDITVVLRAMAATSEHFQARVVYQTADVRTNNPNTPITFGDLKTSTGNEIQYCKSDSVATDTVDAAFIRFGVQYNFEAGYSACRADVELEVSYSQCGNMIASVSTQLNTATTTSQYLPLTNFMPGIIASKVKLACIVVDRSGDFQWRPVYRLAEYTKEEPGSWTDLSTGWYDADEEFNTGELVPTIVDKMYIQFGIEYCLSSTTPGQVSIAVAVGIRRN